jgi:hypothetical protein
MDSIWVSYAADGKTITGVYSCEQEFPTTALAANDPNVVAFLNPPAPPQTVLSQDLMAQITVADYSAIMAAIAATPALGLLWSQMQAQKDPMLVTNTRFLAGWAALVQVLGQPRMTAIATALGVTIT